VRRSPRRLVTVETYAIASSLKDARLNVAQPRLSRLWFFVAITAMLLQDVLMLHRSIQ
jgi:hypothetical protein